MSGKFKFNLQKLLDIRKEQEEMKRLEFKKTSDEYNMLEKEVDFMKQSYDNNNRFVESESTIDRKIRMTYLKGLSLSITERENLLDNKKEQL